MDSEVYYKSLENKMFFVFRFLVLPYSDTKVLSLSQQDGRLHC
jgi:hypothetical protein